ncbi:hypothetical protein HAX54_021882 [Datura stramonium]|uniref:F-box associated beta-propeller type 1 domain-containing protein n=1 Tax=Datura stramonium TaxID=4076 RepID=A0ABS8S3J3_DATST|nr:hypothetical protein [Datura stramonium]
MVEDAQKLVCPLSSKRAFRVLCGCDGLVLVIVSDILSDSRPMHLLWNPSTRESVVLPTPEFQIVDFTRYRMGYDSTSGDYKILKICNEKYDCNVHDEIIALKGSSRRKIDKHPLGVCNAMTRTSALAFVHEAFHWIGSSRNYSLLSFSISNEVYGEVPLPEQILSFAGNIFLGVSVLDGMLCVHSVTFRERFEICKLWVLKDYGFEW